MHRTPIVLVAACSRLFGAVLMRTPPAASQQAETHEQRAERFRQMSIAAETRGLGEPFPVS